MRIIVTLETNDTSAGWAALKRLLKTLLRSYGLKCVSLSNGDETEVSSDIDRAIDEL